jgi:hypothetical protein
MDDVLGLRLNVWTSIVLFVLAAVWFVWSAKRHPGREEVVRTREPRVDDAAGTEDAEDGRRAGPTA